MTVAALHQALTDPGIYPEPTTRVEVRETHISLVYLTDRYAYKIKKPVDFGFVDYSSLAQRQALCQQELVLNRRLSSAVYLDVVPIYSAGQRYTFTDTGSVVDYAVKMRKLPADATLAHLLRQHQVTRSHMQEIARTVASFHAAYALPASAQEYGTYASVTADWEENFQQTASSVGHTVSHEAYGFIQQTVTTFLERHQAWFDQRVQDGRIRDCHGDLRAEHIYRLDDHLQIIDCIEFNDRFRYIDVASEVAFLVMDLERLGFPTYAQAFVRAYVEASGDVTLYRLLDFYCCYRAYVRGKVRSLLLQEAAAYQDPVRVRRDAERCFAFAARFAARLNRPLLCMTTGLIGSGKSTIAAGIAAALDLQQYSSDRLRKEQAGLAPETPQHVAYGTGLYSADISRQTYATLASLARTALQQGRSVVIDAACSKQAQRQCFKAIADATGAECYVLECSASEAVIRQRLAARLRTPGSVSDGRLAILPQFQHDYEPVTASEALSQIRLDTAQPVEQSVQEALAAIQEGRSLYDCTHTYPGSG
jgi:aminoglycoside phosphotransferase family enzyme/predicted kinase